MGKLFFKFSLVKTCPKFDFTKTPKLLGLQKYFEFTTKIAYADIMGGKSELIAGFKLSEKFSHPAT